MIYIYTSLISSFVLIFSFPLPGGCSSRTFTLLPSGWFSWRRSCTRSHPTATSVSSSQWRSTPKYWSFSHPLTTIYSSFPLFLPPSLPPFLFSSLPNFTHSSLSLSQVPVNLLRASRIFTFEPPPGVKANLIRTFSTVPTARMCKVSVLELNVSSCMCGGRKEQS